MTRSEARKLALKRLSEAQALLAARLYSGAYYISGYAMEHALKACILRNFFARSRWPDKQFVNQIHTHDPFTLVRLATLQPQLNAELAANGQFEVYWSVAKQWSVDARYQTWTRRDAEDMITAISEPNHGVLRWIKLHW